MPFDPNQVPFEGMGVMSMPLEIDLHVTIVPDMNDWSGMGRVRAVNTVVEQLEDLGPGVHIKVGDVEGGEATLVEVREVH